MSWDPYLDLEHGVLRNRLGITDRDELAHAEAVLTATRLYELAHAALAGDNAPLHRMLDRLFAPAAPDPARPPVQPPPPREPPE